MTRYKNFRLGDLFTLKGVKQAKSQKDIPTEVPGISYVIQSQRNNMVCRTVSKEYLLAHDEPVEEGNAIVLGVTLSVVSYQKAEFGASQVITARAPFLNECTGLYMATVIGKQLYRFSYTHKPGIKAYSELELLLPVMTVMVPDWTMLETLLNVHGGGGVDMSEIDTSSWKKFKISDLFTAETGDVDLQQKDVNGKGVALVSSGESNTGVIGKTDVLAKVIPQDTITVDMFGSVQYRDFEYKMVTHARVFALVPKEPIGCEVGLFLATLIRKLTTGFSYNNMCSWNKVKDLEISLPVTIKDIPDWDLMGRYIRTMEKLVIKDVVNFKDAFIASAKGLCAKHGNPTEVGVDTAKDVAGA